MFKRLFLVIAMAIVAPVMMVRATIDEIPTNKTDLQTYIGFLVKHHAISTEELGILLRNGKPIASDTEKNAVIIRLAERYTKIQKKITADATLLTDMRPYDTMTDIYFCSIMFGMSAAAVLIFAITIKYCGFDAFFDVMEAITPISRRT